MFDDIKASVMLNIFWKLLEFEPEEESNINIVKKEDQLEDAERSRSKSKGKDEGAPDQVQQYDAQSHHSGNNSNM